MTDRKKLVDVFMHMGDHIRSLDEYGFGFDSTLAKAIEDVVAMLKQPEAEGVILATDNNVGGKWIPVSERLPENTEKVLALSKSRFVNGYLLWLVRYNPDVGAFYDYDSEWGNIKIHDITHWMPIPEPPKED